MNNKNNTITYRKPEILAPAGSFEALKAAVFSGADAIYLGGSRFGARAYAGNFDEKELLEGIYYAHLYGVKVYLTINTLFRNDEIDELYTYLMPYYKAGLDAVIVQDFGVMEYIHLLFPDLPIHASTQINITTQYSYGLLKDYGVTRIVPARELSIEEIISLKSCDYGIDCLPPEIEVFVQGALCICYSGQCLMSSFIGGRSGNRGRCAQSCRLPYSIIDHDGKEVCMDGEYLLSPKDLCGLKAIPELIFAGVDSFKIEGRMKKPEYVASCVNAYRKCTDYIYNNISDNHAIQSGFNDLVDECRNEMASVFNRGGFTVGYFHKKNGRDMMSVNSPGHLGVDIGKIININRNQIAIKLNKDINPGDILVIRDVDPEVTLTSNAEGLSGDIIYLNAPRSKELHKDMKIHRMMDSNLENKLSQYKEKIRKIPVEGTLTLKKGKKAVLKLSVNDYLIETSGLIVEEASAKPLAIDIIKEKLVKTGNTIFQFDKLFIEMDDNIFYPMKALKQLRRDAFSKLDELIIDSYKRAGFEEDYYIKRLDHYNSFHYKEESKYAMGRYHVIVSSKRQISIIEMFGMKTDNIDISLDLQYFNKSDIMELVEKYTKIGLILPMIFRSSAVDELNSIPINKFASITVRNIDELAYLKYKGYTGLVVTDYSLYAMNDMAADFIHDHFSDIIITLPVELNSSQLGQLKYTEGCSEWIVYNYQPLMVTAQCFKEITSGCIGKDSRDLSFSLKDRTKRIFYIKTICKYCYNILFNGVPTVLVDKNIDTLTDNCRKRIQFSIEDDSKIMPVLNSAFNGEDFSDNHTNGHFNRGVI